MFESSEARSWQHLLLHLATVMVFLASVPSLVRRLVKAYPIVDQLEIYFGKCWVKFNYKLMEVYLSELFIIDVVV